MSAGERAAGAEGTRARSTVFERPPPRERPPDTSAPGPPAPTPPSRAPPAPTPDPREAGSPGWCLPKARAA